MRSQAPVFLSSPWNGWYDYASLWVFWIYPFYKEAEVSAHLSALLAVSQPVDLLSIKSFVKSQGITHLPSNLTLVPRHDTHQDFCDVCDCEELLANVKNNLLWCPYLYYLFTFEYETWRLNLIPFLWNVFFPFFFFFLMKVILFILEASEWQAKEPKWADNVWFHKPDIHVMMHS